MSHNYQLLDKRYPANGAKRPRCTVRVAAAWRCREGAPGTDLRALRGDAGRRGAFARWLVELAASSRVAVRHD